MCQIREIKTPKLYIRKCKIENARSYVTTPSEVSYMQYGDCLVEMMMLQR